MKMHLLFIFIFSAQSHAIFDAYHAHKAYQAGDVPAAQAHYQGMIADDYANWRALYNLGTIALNEKQYEQAVYDFEKVVALQPDNQQAQERLEIARKLRDQEQEQQKQQEQQQKEQEEKEKQEQEKQEQQQKQNQQDNAEQNDTQDKQDQDQQQSDQQESQNKKQQQEREQNSNKQQEKQEKEEKQQQDQKKTDAQEQRSAEEKKKQEEAQKKAAEREKARAAAAQEEDKRFSKREQYVLKELDKIDQQIQKEMVQYAVSQGEQEGAHGTRKSW